MHSLTDTDLMHFLREGYLKVEPKVSQERHRYLYKRAQALYRKAAELTSRTTHLEVLGDNLLAQVPQLQEVLSDASVVAAVEGLLGERYVLHPHHFVHKSGAFDQGFHQDGNLPWNERGHYRSHRPDWLILLYYPQQVDERNGPTEMAPGTQYWTRDMEDGDTWHPDDQMDRGLGDDLKSTDAAFRARRIQEGLDNLGVPNLERRLICVPAGTVVLAHYDVVHRGTRATPDAPDRFLYKFFFARTSQPRHSTPLLEPSLEGVPDMTCPIVRYLWCYCKGMHHSRIPCIVDEEAATLHSGREDQRVYAAYRLAADGSTSAVAALGTALRGAEEGERRAAMHGLCAVGGSDVVATLLEAAGDSRRSVRRCAVYALGTVPAGEEIAAVLLDRLANDVDGLVRSNAAYAVGHMVQRGCGDVVGVATALLARLAPGVEGVNTRQHLLPRSTVRQNVAYALALLLHSHALPTASLAPIATLAGTDSDRYVRGLLLTGLCHTEAGHLKGLLTALSAQRYSALEEVVVESEEKEEGG